MANAVPAGVRGYAKIAARMSTQPELAIFRRFQALHNECLLYMQAELVQLESKLRQQAAIDAASDGIEKYYCKDWAVLSSKDGDGYESEQWKIIQTIETRLERYYQALSSHAKVSRTLQKPRKHDVEILKELQDDLNLGDDYIIGDDKDVWRDERTRDDLISATPLYDFDVLSISLIKLLLRPYHKYIGSRTKPTADGDANLYHYDDRHLEFPGHVVSTTLASLLPIVATVALYLAESMRTRLGLLAVFTTVFAICLAVLSKRKIEVFTATAA